MKDFLFEIQCEEIPARFQLGAQRQMEQIVHKALEGITYGDLAFFMTPKRMAVMIQSLSHFPESLFQDIMDGIKWPKSMRWKTHTVWVRPVRGFMALYGQEVVAWQWQDMVAGRQTSGHRLGKTQAPLTIAQPSDYETALREAWVEPCFSKRAERIEHEVKAMAQAQGFHIYPEGFAAMVMENAGLTQWPVPVLGRFDADFLALPECVIACVLQKHQRCFPLIQADETLAAAFVMISDGHALQALHGYECVVRARLSDGLFFWQKDRKKTLEEHGQGLKDREFFQGLGSLWDKTERLVSLAEPVAHLLGLDPEKLRQSARMSKSDMMTHMVQEFPVLQGMMGKVYAQMEGVEKDVAQSLADHYHFHKEGGDLGRLGAGLALMDAADTLVGLFTLGKRPSGSGDPLALRRAAHSLLRAMSLCAKNWSLPALLERVLAVYHDQGYLVGQTLPQDLVAFIKTRWLGLIKDPVMEETELKQVFKAEDDLLRGRDQVRLWAQIKREVPVLLVAYDRLVRLLDSVDKDSTTDIQKVDLASLRETLEKPEECHLMNLLTCDPMAHLIPWAEGLMAFFERIHVMDPNHKTDRLALLKAVRAQFGFLSFLDGGPKK